MVITHKTIIRSVLEYGAPVWNSGISDSNWIKLQNIQNSALQIATGNHKMASLEHIHRETKVLPLKDHGQLLSKQFLATCHNPIHPCHEYLNQPSYKRNMKKTILQHKEEVSQLMVKSPTKDDIKSAVANIHTFEVQKTLNSYPPNKVLGSNPPGINIEEEELPRYVRSILSQLRSGYCNLLNCYRNRINDEIPNECPRCGATPHNTVHLFKCPKNPTDLTPLHLWIALIKTAEFLELERESTEAEGV